MQESLLVQVNVESEKLKTHADIARAAGVTTRTVSAWSEYDGWPRKGENGEFSREDVFGFLQENGLGPFNQSRNREERGGEGDELDGLSLQDVKKRLQFEQSENERIKKERQLVEQAKELHEIVAMEDIRKLYMQTLATVSAVDDSLIDVVDRAMPESPPDAGAWADIRERVLAFCRKHRTDTAAAMMELA